MKLDPTLVGKRCRLFGTSAKTAVIVAVSADRKHAFIDARPDEPNVPARFRMEEVDAGRIASIVGQKASAQKIEV